MTDFHDVIFPTRLAFGATGGPVRRTDILQLASSGEARNAPHRYSRRRYNAVAGLKSSSEAVELMNFFEARLGALHGFRFRDPLDHIADDVNLGLGDGDRTTFQLQQHYGAAPHTQTRPLTKPVEGTVRIAVNGIETDATQIDYLSGTVTFDTPPANGTIITGSCTFDVPVRFDTDRLDIALDDFAVMRIDDVPLIEVLDYV